MRRSAGALSALLLLAGGCAFGEPEDPPPPPPQFPTPTVSETPPELTAGAQDVIAAGLELPWGIDFLPDGAALVTERDTGRILRVGPEEDGGGRLRVTEVQTIADVNPAGEGGLLGIAVSPDYASDRTVFIYYTTADDNRIGRLVLGEEPEPILTGIPRSGNHNGGRLAFGPDGYLYAGTGDAADGRRSQDPEDPAGGVLRMTADGEPAPDNPFDGHVYAYGLRNVQGLAWDETGQLWVTEFGDDRVDELNRIEAGGNYGWPEVEGPGGEGDFIDPEVWWPTSEASCSGLAVVTRTIVAACLRGQRLWLLDLTGSGTIVGAPTPLLEQEYGRLRAAVPAPDGSLWVATSNLDNRLRPGPPDPEDDRIIRLVWEGSEGAGQT